MRKQIAAANWKMNLSLQQAETLTDELLAARPSLDEHHIAVLGVPFPYLVNIQARLNGQAHIFVAAQNCADKKSGAYTGETSVEMLQSIGVQYVIIGHSERREYYYETSGILTDKINLALEYGLTPIFCCGEPLTVRDENIQNSYVETQLIESLFHLSAEEAKKIIIAYEPIWAIGTGRTASHEQAQEMHAHIRQVLAGKFGQTIADDIPVLYGGSVKGANAPEIFGQPDVDGDLVGGASLVATEFATIINSLKR
jgi:triosephosphate isomerase (TIM)